MPISEDELDHKTSAQHHHQAYHTHHNMQIPHQQVSGMSKAEQRRSNKPIMEKRRRARINHCLNELKTLILDAMKKDPARHSKLEKADILEMTVKHLQNVQRQQLAVAVATDPTVLHKFRTGFNECAGEVSRYIGRIEGVDPTVRSRLLAHLASCVSGLHQLTPFSFGAMAAAATPPPPPPQLPFPHLGAPSAASVPSPADEGGGVLPGAPRSSASAGIPRSVPYSTGDVNNNQRQNTTSGAMTGLQLIPGRMPPGELTLLLPGSALLTSEGDHKTFSSSALTPSAPTPSQTSSAGGGPSPSSSGSSPGHLAHQSAFTAVARANSPVPPSAVNLAPGPPSPASSSSSSCASTSCDSASFQNSSPASSSAPALLQQQPSSEAPKFSFRFPCSAIPTAPLGGSGETRAFPFPPPASLMHARVPPFIVEPRSCTKEREEVGVCRVTAPIEMPLESSDQSVSEFSSPLIYSVCPTAASSSSSASAPSSLLPDAMLPRPPALLIPPSIPRDVLDFSVKRDRATMEESDVEVANRSPNSPRGVKRSNSIELAFPSRGEEAMLPLAKMARLEVKVESSSRNDEDKTEAKEASEGRLSAKQVTTATDGSSAICNSANASCEDGAGCLDMWRPW